MATAPSDATIVNRIESNRISFSRVAQLYQESAEIMQNNPNNTHKRHTEQMLQK